MMPSAIYRSYGGGRASRLPRACYPEQNPVHVVIATFERRDLFADRALATAVFDVARRQAPLAACLMPDHLHWVLASCDRLSDQVRSFKLASTRAVWAAGYRGKLWQRSFYDHVIRDEEDLERTISYVLGNPVTAGLVEVAEDWPFLYVGGGPTSRLASGRMPGAGKTPGT
jgi:REP element-mobilizing transposase RayT